MKTEIIIGRIQVNEIRNNASAVYGDNSLNGWRSHSKVNYSLGRVNGDANLIASRLNYLSDPDGIDVNVVAGSDGNQKETYQTQPGEI
ncbi:MAG: hypothetical protein ABSC17_04925 [Thermacetogeniaceae bacterium]